MELKKIEILKEEYIKGANNQQLPDSQKIIFERNKKIEYQKRGNKKDVE